jgi:5-methylcytosine-specific restriction endonuclease McrBC regulatory subunit McrC
MDTLFERYVTAVLREMAIMPPGDLETVAQDTHILDLDRQVTVKPDVVVYRGETPVLALDAKYKLDDPNADIYQALAYCHALKVPRAILAYPASEAIAAMRYLIQPDGKTEVVLLPLNLSGDVIDLKRQTRVFVEAVWQEVASA